MLRAPGPGARPDVGEAPQDLGSRDCREAEAQQFQGQAPAHGAQERAAADSAFGLVLVDDHEARRFGSIAWR